MLYIDIAKVDRNVAHVGIAIHVCFKCMFQTFHLVQTYDANVLSGCYIYMHVFSERTYTCMLQAHISSVFRCFIRMFAHVLS
jgi:hypothetical protein